MIFANILQQNPMDNIYLFMMIAITILAVVDIVVGVSNDAVNFLNSAVGSRVAKYQTIILVAATGIIIGSIFSSGIMEIARKGIFYPQFFTLDKLLWIFMAVMLTDIILLDFFNSLGLPTSTTVSLVFELLGAALITGRLEQCVPVRHPLGCHLGLAAAVGVRLVGRGSAGEA